MVREEGSHGGAANRYDHLCNITHKYKKERGQRGRSSDGARKVSNVRVSFECKEGQMVGNLGFCGQSQRHRRAARVIIEAAAPGSGALIKSNDN